MTYGGHNGLYSRKVYYVNGKIGRGGMEDLMEKKGYEGRKMLYLKIIAFPKVTCHGMTTGEWSI